MFGDPDTQTFMATLSGSNFCGDCTVLSGQIVLKYMDGTTANTSNGVYVHHILTTGMKTSTPFVKSCGALPGGPGFVGNGDDNSNDPVLYASKDGSLESGFWVSPADRFLANCKLPVLLTIQLTNNHLVVLVNYNKEPKKVDILYDLEYLPGHVGKSVKSTLISASCGLIKTSKTSAVNTTSSPMTFTEDGYIVLARGHIRQYIIPPINSGFANFSTL